MRAVPATLGVRWRAVALAQFTTICPECCQPQRHQFMQSMVARVMVGIVGVCTAPEMSKLARSLNGINGDEDRCDKVAVVLEGLRSDFKRRGQEEFLDLLDEAERLLKIQQSDIIDALVAKFNTAVAAAEAELGKQPLQDFANRLCKILFIMWLLRASRRAVDSH